MSTTAAIALLEELAERGIEIEAAGDKVRFGPAGAVDDALLGQIEALKPELLKLLGKKKPAPRPQPPRTAPRRAGRPPARAPNDWVAWRASRGSSKWASDAALVINELARSLEGWFMLQATHLEAKGMKRTAAEQQAFGQLLFEILRRGIDVKAATQTRSLDS